MIDLITTKKNLLAFSGGVDSSALFFMLYSQNIEFDIAIIDYNQRESSKEEVLYAKELALEYNKKCFIKTYDDSRFSEKLARNFRYDFFESIIKEHAYQSLITAHQLNDQLEWFLMQLSKGAGLIELVGLQQMEIRNFYKLYRPLLNVSKNDLLEYLNQNKIKYFIDESNFDSKYKRNFFRHKFSDDFVDLYKTGLIKSFEYLNKDIKSLKPSYQEFRCEKFILMKFDSFDTNLAIREIDKELKKRVILISSKTREEILNQKSIVVSHEICVEIVNNTIMIAPFEINIMDKKFKEKCRLSGIPKNLRGYIYTLQLEESNKIINELKLSE